MVALVVVLILLEVDAAVFLPFATFALAFSFAFGNFVKNIVESLVLVLRVLIPVAKTITAPAQHRHYQK
jgi:hypothetical protein